MSIYGQCGYGKSTKINDGIRDGSLSGVIIGPKSEKPENVKAYIDQLKTSYPDVDILLDTQFYISALEGEVNEGKLPLYSFYIEDVISKKFLSVPKNVQQVVFNNFQYQNDIGLNRIISPTIQIGSFDSRESQICLSLANEAIMQFEEYRTNKSLIISLCIRESAFEKMNDVKDFLDIISLYDVQGFYILIDRENNKNPNMIESKILTNIMYFCYNLANINNYEVILGYSDYIGIPLYCTGVNAIATGWFNGLRRFSTEDFYPKSGGRRANKRYFSDKLLNSLLINPIISTIDGQGLTSQILSNTPYDKYLLSNFAGDDWSDEVSCLHNWATLKQISNQIDKYQLIYEKSAYVLTLIDNAMGMYSYIEEDFFDIKSKSSHLPIWKVAIEQFLELIK